MTDAYHRNPPLVSQLNALLLGPLLHKYSSFPHELIHYTSVEAFAAILASGTLRMSHFRHLNDSTEMLHGRTVANELLAGEALQNERTSRFFDFCRFAFNEQDDHTIQYFLTSFSVLTDFPELWRRYGANGCGVAISFTTRRMSSDLSEQFSYHIGRITYSRDEQIALLSPLLQGAKEVLARYIATHGYDLLDPTIQRFSAQLCSHLAHHSIALKHEKWRIEQEWRTVLSVLANDTDEHKARVAIRGDGRPFVDVRVRSVEPDDDRMPIVKVVAGVNADASMIRATLDNSGYAHVQVVRSTASEDDLAK